MQKMSEKSPVELVRIRLKEWAKSDPALASKFNGAEPTKLQDCWEHIVEQARKRSKEGTVGCVCVDDETVYRWARDFYVDGKANDAKSPEDDPATAAKFERQRKRRAKQYGIELKDTAEPHPADPTVEETHKADDSQLDLFAEVQA